MTAPGINGKAGPRQANHAQGVADAAALRGRGLALCKPDPDSKSPTYRGWTTGSLEPDDFGPDDLMGVICGPLSDGNMAGHALVVVDLDDPTAVSKADQFLPATAMAEGKSNKPRDHRYYLVPCATIPEACHSPAVQAAAAAKAQAGHPGPWKKGFNDSATKKRVIDFIGTGGQAVCPSAANQRRWFGGSPGAPAVVPFPELWDAVTRLATSCGCEPQKESTGRDALHTFVYGGGREYVIDRARKYLARIEPAVSGRGGHGKTFYVACKLILGFDLSIAEARPLMWEYSDRCDPPWDDKDIDHKLDDADKKPGPRGYLLAADRPAGGGSKKDEKTDAWPAPIPFDAPRDLPPFPVHLLPAALSAWVDAESTAKQTPPDLAAQLALAVCGAALATKFRIKVRDGWAEPTNLFTVVALLPGERKSPVFASATAPVVAFEREEQERMAPVIAAAASEHRMMEARLKAAEQKAAKAESPEERQELLHEAKQLAKELAAHVVPEPPLMFCDDETVESLGKLIAKQGGRMLQASAEGTAFEIVKGRYSESPNFDVYLKGHAGDPLRTGRVGRERDSTVEQPALSVALAVQPDVIQGLAEHAMLRGRGFLARFLYGMPVSRVGGRVINAQPVPAATAAAYHEAVLRLWRLEGAAGQDGKPAPHWLTFSPAADRRMQDFERWLEPQMAEGEDLSLLAGWAQKLAGAAARIAGVLHVAAAVSEGRPWNTPVGERTAAAAIELARDYYLPHAQAAFAVMGADARLDDAAHAWRALANRCAHAAYSADAPPPVSRRDIHNWNRRRFPTAEELDPALAVLVDRYFLFPVDGTGYPGRGHKSPLYRINPLALRAARNAPPRPHCAQRTHLDSADPASAHSAHSADAPSPPEDGAEPEAEGFTDPSYDPASNPFRDDEEAI